MLISRSFYGIDQISPIEELEKTLPVVEKGSLWETRALCYWRIEKKLSGKDKLNLKDPNSQMNF